MDISFIDEAVRMADNNESKCTQDILQLDGMSGNKTRHLYNNLCAWKKPDGSPLRYLEIGCFKGSSTVSALYKNNCLSTVIDNWSQFGGQRHVFEDNLEKYIDDWKTNVQIIEEDCFNMSIHPENGPFDIYMYDGDHDHESHEKAITAMWDYLADTCIIIVDDWARWDFVRTGTLAGLSKVKHELLHKVERPGEDDKNGYWNGFALFLIKKI